MKMKLFDINMFTRIVGWNGEDSIYTQQNKKSSQQANRTELLKPHIIIKVNCNKKYHILVQKQVYWKYLKFKLFNK